MHLNFLKEVIIISCVHLIIYVNFYMSSVGQHISHLTKYVDLMMKFSGFFSPHYTESLLPSWTT